MTSAQLAGLSLAWMVAIVSPGPDLVVVLHHALTRSRRAGLLAAAGVLTGILVWVVAAFFGLASMLQMFPAVMKGLQVAGGALLVYLGVEGLRQAWTTRRARADSAVSPQESLYDGAGGRPTNFSAYWKGLGTNLANPKALVFFAAILAPFLPAAVPVAEAALIIGLLLLLAGAWFGVVAVAASHRALVVRFQEVKTMLDLGASGLFVLLGVAFCLAVVWP
ncbi:LysE family translocator [Kocuria sp. CPCC 205297]|uniref:LysE family translocator n=1 Tax=Kocuria TaxID=57493 RepID=UPI0034D5C504